MDLSIFVFMNMNQFVLYLCMKLLLSIPKPVGLRRAASERN